MLESNIRILVIEDNPGDVNLLRAMLHTASESVPQLSFELISAEYLREAVELLSKEKFDLVILDLHLPDSVGIETYQVLSRSLPNTPVIVLSGNDEGDLGLQTVRSGGQDYLIKGQIDGQLLTRSILYSIERHQMRETLRKSNEVLHNVFERTADGILIVDPRNRVLFTNPAAEEMLDRKRGELIGQEVWFPVQSQTPTEVTFRRSGRTTIRVELLNEEIQWHEEKAYLLSLRDITERDRIKVQLQEEVENRTRELLHLNQSLQEQIRERTEL
ncbi:response regulator, partial [bacterium]|nr:response regulator [bacterium]